MVTPSRVLVLLLLVLIVAISAWSRLRFLDEDSFKPQRIRIEDFPAVHKSDPSPVIERPARAELP